mmetsp:Transcript_33961/g.96237  ORF Transcript_33961/g.96237 Transcript_33961/m.96237 type:complete len:636 (+) Transcript_33961:90-1997(+)
MGVVGGGGSGPGGSDSAGGTAGGGGLVTPAPRDKGPPTALLLALPLPGPSRGDRDSALSSVTPPMTKGIKGATRRSPRSPRGSCDAERHSTFSRSTSTSPRLSWSDTESGGADPKETIFQLHGSQYSLVFDNQGINLTRIPTECLCRGPPFLHTEHFPFQEILRAGIADAQHGTCFPVQRDYVYKKKSSFLVVHTFQRGKKNSNEWHPLELVLEHHAEDVVATWANAINGRINLLASSSRPRRVRVWINPFGGKRRAVQVWNSLCVPIFESAGVKVNRTLTQWAGHARAEVDGLGLEELLALDGLVVVGGDGLFGEVLNGVLALRSSGDGPRAAAAARLRLGHIPAGSTDAVAWSVNGTRKAETAALHIVLGDRIPLDVQRIDVPGSPPSFSCCLAAAGFLGEVLQTSEKMRWAGPHRYDIAGLYAFLRHGSHHIRVSYIPAEDPAEEAGGEQQAKMTNAKLPVRPCQAGCVVCRQAIGLRSLEAHPLPGQEPELPWASSSDEYLRANADRVRTVEGRYKSILCVVTPCRSDHSPAGVAPSLHLADGRMLLVMVKQCNHIEYLRFLVMLSTSGALPGHLSYVDILECEAAKVEPLSHGCKWNVDGEPLPQKTAVSLQVHRGLVEVFARGMEPRCR